VPGDKSISHRAVILGSLAHGETRVTNFAPGRDVRNTIACMRALGADITLRGDHVEIRGTGGALSEPADVLDCGNSGTTMRLLAGVLAGCPFHAVVTGDGSLRNRPMDRIIEPLRTMGARIHGRGEDRFAPLIIRGGRLRGIRYDSPVASAQVKSAVLLAGLLSGDDTAVAEPGQSRDHTERMLRHFGAEVVNLGHEMFLEGGSPDRLRAPADPLAIPGDPSSAAFLAAAALLVPGSEIVLRDVGTNPTRGGFFSVLERAGVNMFRENVRQWGGEPVADIHLSGGPIRAFEVRASEVPSLIDEIPVLALLASRAYGVSIFHGVGELRVKETDRLGALIDELGALGVELQTVEDDLVVRGQRDMRDAGVDARGDHRMAMTLALAGLCGIEVDVQGTRAIDISYPGFADDMTRLGVCVHRPKQEGLLGLLGYPARHSLSPRMFRAAFSAAGLDWDYRTFEVSPEALPDALDGVRALDLAGANVTVPHKQTVIDQLDALDEAAALVGAVNVIARDGARLVGYNTDGAGMLDALRAAGFEPAGSRALVLGAGGAARAATFALAQSGVAALHVANRTPGRAESLAQEASQVEGSPGVAWSDLAAVPGGFDLIIQATSVGMGEDKGCPLPDDYPMGEGTTLLEMVYTPAETPLVCRARERGARVIYGIEMLIAQGERAFAIMVGFSPPANAMRDGVREWLPC